MRDRAQKHWYTSIVLYSWAQLLPLRQTHREMRRAISLDPDDWPSAATPAELQSTSDSASTESSSEEDTPSRWDRLMANYESRSIESRCGGQLDELETTTEWLSHETATGWLAREVDGNCGLLDLQNSGFTETPGWLTELTEEELHLTVIRRLVLASNQISTVDQRFASCALVGGLEVLELYSNHIRSVPPELPKGGAWHSARRALAIGSLWTGGTVLRRATPS